MEYAQLHEEVCDAIVNGEVLRYGNRKQYTHSPMTENDLYDKIQPVSGQILRAYILGDNERILAIMHRLCESEIDSMIDLIGN